MKIGRLRRGGGTGGGEGGREGGRRSIGEPAGHDSRSIIPASVDWLQDGHRFIPNQPLPGESA